MEINKILPEINEIAAVSKEMSASTEEVAASVEQQAGTMGDLSKLSQEIKRTSYFMVNGIEKFKI